MPGLGAEEIIYPIIPLENFIIGGERWPPGDYKKY